MTEVSSDLKVKIFAHYIGQEVTNIGCKNNSEYEVKNGYLTGIKQENGLLELEVQLHDGVCADEEATYFDANEMQIKLLPISEIADEHAYGLAELLKVHYKLPESLINAGRELVSKYWNSSSTNISPNDVALATDYMRSKGYHIPYLGIDLYESGIAIKPLS